MKAIKFSKNWNNKLECDIFTTIRKWTPEKREYYTIGETFDVILRGANHCIAELICTDTYESLLDVPFNTILTDTGSTQPYNIFRRFRVGLDDPVMVLTFKKCGAISGT